MSGLARTSSYRKANATAEAEATETGALLHRPDQAAADSTATPRASARQWRPYEDTVAESPLIAWLLGRDDGLAKFYGFRWALRHPLQTRVIGGLTTVGELVLVLPVLGVLALIAAANATNVEGSGSAPKILLALTLSTACHNSIWTFLFGIPFERALKYHKLFAFLTVGLGIYHGYVAYYSDGEKDEDEDGGAGVSGPGACASRTYSSQPCHPIPGTGEYLSGFVYTVAMAVMVLFSAGPIRRRFFQLFYSVHVIGTVVALGAGVAHGGITGIGVALWAIDLIGRYVLMAFVLLPRKGKLRALPGGTIRLELDKPAGFRYKGGQYLFVCFPGLSLWEWHPFSISSAPHEDKIVVHVRPLGNWTDALGRLAEASAGGEVSVVLEGPYGAPTFDFEGDRYYDFVMVSGGIGVTPLMSMANELLHQSDRGRRMHRLHFVWSVRDRQLVDAVHDASKAHPSLAPAKVATETEPPTREAFVLPTVFQPQLYEPPQSVGDNIVITEFYLTTGDPTIPPTPDPSSTTLLHGRPNLLEIVQRACQAAADVGGETAKAPRVAVLFCGPAKMGAALAKICRQCPQVDLHTETFEF